MHVTRRQLVTFGEQMSRSKFWINWNLSTSYLLWFSSHCIKFFAGSSIARPPSHLSVKQSTQRHLTGWIEILLSSLFRWNIHILPKFSFYSFFRSKPKEKKTKRVQNERDKIVTKTVIHEKNQVCNKALMEWWWEYHRERVGIWDQNISFAGDWAENRQAG